MDKPARDGQRGREELLAKLSLEDKISLLTGADYWSLRGHPGIRLRPVRTSHFVANDSEAQRFTVDARVGERALRELYLAPFESIVRHGRPWAVMAAYNGVNGHTMTESPMLNDILKGEWGFDGVVVSDWRAAWTLIAAEAGLDLVMPGPSGPWGTALVEAVRQGLVSEATIDDKVLRLLRLAARVGALDHDACDRAAEPDRAELWTDERAREALRSTASAGFVLTRNDHSLLPLDPPSLRRVAVLGPNAAAPRTLGGGSATVFPPYRVSPLDGLRAALEPGVIIDYSPGVRSRTRIPLAPPALLHLPGTNEPGVLVEFAAEDGTVLDTERRLGGSCTWRSLPQAVGSARLAVVRVTTSVRALTSGAHVIGCSGHGRFRLTLAGDLAFDTYLTVPGGTDPTEAHIRPPPARHLRQPGGRADCPGSPGTRRRQLRRPDLVRAGRRVIPAQHRGTVPAGRRGNHPCRPAGAGRRRSHRGGRDNRGDRKRRLRPGHPGPARPARRTGPPGRRR